MKSKFKGDIKGFPKEVVKKMLKRQKQQGNKKDVEKFECRRHFGFIWDNTKEGFYFWQDVIMHEKFDLFFKKYPKKK